MENAAHDVKGVQPHGMRGWMCECCILQSDAAASLRRVASVIVAVYDSGVPVGASM